MLEIAFYIFSSFLLISSTMVIFSRNPVHSVLFLILAFFNAAGLFILLKAEFLAMLLVIVYVGAVAVLFLFCVMMLNIVPPSYKTPQIWDQTVLISRAFLGFIAPFSAYLTISIVLLTITYSRLEFLKEYFWNKNLQNIKTSELIFQFSKILGVIFFWYLFIKGCKKDSFGLKGKSFFKLLPLGWILGLIVLAELSYMISYWKDLHFSSLGGLEDSSKNFIPSNTHALGKILYTNYIFPLQIAGLILLQAMIGAILLTHRKRENIKRQNIRDQVARRKEDTLELHDVPLGKGI